MKLIYQYTQFGIRLGHKRLKHIFIPLWFVVVRVYEIDDIGKRKLLSKYTDVFNESKYDR